MSVLSINKQTNKQNATYNQNTLLPTKIFWYFSNTVDNIFVFNYWNYLKTYILELVGSNVFRIQLYLYENSLLEPIIGAINTY